jgi:chemotaxis response regulator CheB
MAMANRDIIVMGASVGGVSTLQIVLSALPWDLNEAWKKYWRPSERQTSM